MTTYLDWNATTPPHRTVLDAMNAAREFAWANPASVHAAGRAARRLQEDTRECLASVVGLSHRDVIFTCGGTEANHLALSGASTIVTSRLEHASITGMAEYLGELGRARVHFVDVEASGVLSLRSLEETLGRLAAAGEVGDRPVLAIQAANQETGALQPLEGAAELARHFGWHLHVDAVQLLGRGPLGSLRVADSIAVSAHKIRGPKGVGALASICGWTPKPLGRGGAQERGLRAGTLDGVALAGFGAALGRLEESRSHYETLRGLRDTLGQKLCQELGAILHADGTDRLAHVLNFRIPGYSGDELVAALDLGGVCVSSGSACSAGSSEPSSVLTAMLGREAAKGAVRVSLGEETTEADLDQFFSALSRVLAADP